MANGAWHTIRRIVVDLTRPDLGHSDIPDLLDEITQPVGQRDRHMLECLGHHVGKPCAVELQGKSPWMLVRRTPINGRMRLIASHLPVTHKVSPGESDKHAALKDRIAAAASNGGLPVDLEVRTSDGRAVTDALVIGSLDGRRIGWEPQLSPITPPTVRRRTKARRDNGITPLWVTNDDRAAVIDRAPWARIDDMSWQRYLNDRHLMVRGGVRHLEIWKCTRSAERPCPDGKGLACGGFHHEWFIPKLLIREQRETTIDELVVGTGTGEFESLFVPNQRDPRTGRYMWVPARDRRTWVELAGEAEPVPETQPEPSEDLEFTYEGVDFECRSGKESTFRNAPRLRRDDGGQAAGVTLSIQDLWRRSRMGQPGDVASGTDRAARPVAPVLRYRTPGVCGHGPGPCGAEGARLYPVGWRCPEHTPARLAGRTEPQPGPGWPAHRDTP